MCVCVCVCVCVCGAISSLTLYPEVVERFPISSRLGLLLVAMERAICSEHKPSRPPVLDVLTWRRGGGRGWERGEREGEGERGRG